MRCSWLFVLVLRYCGHIVSNVLVVLVGVLTEQHQSCHVHWIGRQNECHAHYVNDLCILQDRNKLPSDNFLSAQDILSR